jgi:hypothetical protein
VITQADRENYGEEFIDLARRAAADALQPELQQLRAQNQQLRQMAARAQNADIRRALDQALPNWQEIYADPDFADWLSAPDDYSAATRSQLLRNAVANGDASRVAAIYRGFQREGHAPAYQSRAPQSRPAATGGKPIYTRQQITDFYKQRRDGRINDANWARREADIIAAGREGRVVGAVNPVDGTEMTRLAR